MRAGRSLQDLSPGVAMAPERYILRHPASFSGEGAEHTCPAAAVTTTATEQAITTDRPWDS